MSLEGLRAWIGEVERKLGKRTRVFLALAVIAIGLGGAAIYLAIDARESSVSESDVQELQRQLEAQIDEATTGVGATTEPPAEPIEPTEPTPESEPEPERESGQGKKEGATGGVGASGASGSSEAGAAAGDTTGKSQVQELLDKAKEHGVEIEEGQAGR